MRKKYPSDSREVAVEYQRRYRSKCPWVKHYYSSRGRLSRREVQEHTLLVKDIKELWFRDSAFLLKRPSIDRIDPTRGYTKDNCRFLELGENISIGNLGRRKEMKHRKLTLRAVRKIKQLLAGTTPIAHIARAHGVAPGTIQDIKNGICYRYVK